MVERRAFNPQVIGSIPIILIFSSRVHWSNLLFWFFGSIPLLLVSLSFMILKQHYLSNIRRDLISIFHSLDIPRLESIVIHHTSRQILSHPDSIVPMLLAFQFLSGQKPTKLIARKSVATWQVRQGQLIGCKVTLRGDAMFNFLTKLIFNYFPKVNNPIAFPLPTNPSSFSFGIPDLFLFSEIEAHYDLFRSAFPNHSQFGCHVTFVMKSNSVEHSTALLRSFFIPIKTS